MQSPQMAMNYKMRRHVVIDVFVLLDGILVTYHDINIIVKEMIF